MKTQLLRSLALLLILALLLPLSSCGVPKVKVKGETTTFTDDCGRTVTVPVEIKRVAPSGAVAQMILTAIAPDLLAGLAGTPGTSQLRYLPENYIDLPTFGQFTAPSPP